MKGIKCDRCGEFYSKEKRAMQITEKKITEIKPYEKNPRKNEGAIEYVANSIKEFGFKVPIVIDSNGVIVAGHTRYIAAKSLGMKSVPCVIADDLTDEQIKAFRLADNKVAEFSEWDFDLLSEELDSIFDVDMSEFGFENQVGEETAEEKYTQKIKTPIYEPTEECPDIQELADIEKCKELIEEINQSGIKDKQIKDFLKISAMRHIVFNYSKIAEYYAHASADVQNLMEKSALVIIDVDKAIENGFVKLNEELAGMIESDEE